MTLRPVDPAVLRAQNGFKWGTVAADVLPASIADMDFGVPPAVQRAMRDIIDRGELTYRMGLDSDFAPAVAAFERRMASKYHWQPTPERTRVFCDVMQVLQIVIEHATRPGDAVAMHLPAYPLFLHTLGQSNRRIVPIEMTRTSGTDSPDWTFDMDGLAARLEEEGVKVLILVNPQNPTGWVFTRDELEALADVAERLDLVVVSDEIHSDVVYDNAQHIPFASLSEDAAARTVTATSASKTFNIPALHCAIAHIGPQWLHEVLSAMPWAYLGSSTDLAQRATIAAWEESADWYEALLKQLAQNRQLISDWVAQNEFEIGYAPPEATFLAWLDFANTPLADSEPADAILAFGKVRLALGSDFSMHTEVDTRSWARLNFGTDQALLAEMLERINTAMVAASDPW